MSKLTISISKTIQECSYEPFSVTISCELDECTPTQENIDQLYTNVLTALDRKMEERLEAMKPA